MPCVICYSVTSEVYSYLAVEIPEPSHILPKTFRDGQTDCINVGMNLLSNCPMEVIALPCLTSSYLKDQQVLVAQILLKWHLLVSAYNEKHAGISKLPLNDQVEVCVCGGIHQCFLFWRKSVYGGGDWDFSLSPFGEREPLQLLIFFYCKSVEDQC